MNDDLASVFRREVGRCTATLIRVLGDIDLAEDAVGEAFAIAAERWPVHGMPPNPGGWITTTARNRAIDRLRRESSRAERHLAAHRLHTITMEPDLDPELDDLDAFGDGSMVRLADQVRGCWDQVRIRRVTLWCAPACDATNRAHTQIQAATAAVHAEARSSDATDWAQIVALYDQLCAYRLSAVVALNRAIAIGELRGAADGLGALDALDADRLAGYQPYHAARADLLARSGRAAEAVAAYDRAIERTTNAAERAFLVASGTPSPATDRPTGWSADGLRPGRAVVGR